MKNLPSEYDFLTPNITSNLCRPGVVNKLILFNFIKKKNIKFNSKKTNEKKF